MTNYRPISLLTSFAKFLEKIIYDRLINNIQINNILVEELFGFRTSSSTDKAAFKLIDEILNALNNKLMVAGIICDLQKAFVYVNHNILLTELEFYGITGTAYKLIKSYIQGRYQRVVLNTVSLDSCSNWGEMNYGVPQESLLCPLLFFKFTLTTYLKFQTITPKLSYSQTTLV